MAVPESLTAATYARECGPPGRARRPGDVDLDGYPDALVVVQLADGTTGMRLLANVACTDVAVAACFLYADVSHRGPTADRRRISDGVTGVRMLVRPPCLGRPAGQRSHVARR